MENRREAYGISLPFASATFSDPTWAADRRHVTGTTVQCSVGRMKGRIMAAPTAQRRVTRVMPQLATIFLPETGPSALRRCKPRQCQEENHIILKPRYRCRLALNETKAA
ncbi:hypothetical protein TRVL_06785 [Trypanosoma vivax]|nr:hypothetical protein TRVL_06785 [Trypanosoma vivax]